MTASRPQTLGEKLRKLLRLSNARLVSQVVFVWLFLFAVWASWTSRIKGYPVSRFLEIDPLIALSTALSTGYIYKYLGWSVGVLALTFLFGRVFCNWFCPFGTLHQFVGWLFNILTTRDRIKQNSYSPLQYLKYALLVALFLLAVLGTLQIGLLDPMAMMYRGVAVFAAPAWDSYLDLIVRWFGSDGAYLTVIDQLKTAPGVSRRVFTGSFWIGLWFLLFVVFNLWKTRGFCRFFCPLGALLGVLSRYSLFQINRDVARCTDCNLCLSRCEGASDPQQKIRKSECLSCLNCIDDCPEDALAFTIIGIDRRQALPGPALSRRHFLFAGIAGLLAFPLIRHNGLATDENFSPEMIRPPGSIAEPEFLRKCIKCDQCINVCPTNVLQPAALMEGGIETLWTPVMKFNISHCQLKCSLCSEVCPTGAIRQISVAEKLGKGAYEPQGPVRLGTAFVNKSRCLPWANQIPCVVCQEVCPVSPKAIQTFNEEVKDVFGKRVVVNKPFIVPDLCIGCGICQSSCPVQDQPAVFVTAVGESRSRSRRLLLQYRG